MAGYQTMEMPRPRFGNGAPQMPVVDVRLVRSPAVDPLTLPVSALANKQRADGARSYGWATDEMKAEMRARRALGQTQDFIAAALGVSRICVGRAVKDVPAPEGGFPIGGNPSKAPLAPMQRMKRAGFTYDEIAANFGLSKTAIWKRLNRDPGGKPSQERLKIYRN
jgi:biotin operon repressor